MKNNNFPARKAFGKNEIRQINSLINFYKKQDYDPPYKGRFESIFNKNFSKFHGGGYTCRVATGSLSYLVALQSLQLKKDSEVLISAINDAGTLNSIIFLGLKPVLVDLEKGSFDPDEKDLKSKINKKTKAVILAHIAGGPISKISKFCKILRKKKIPIIEDCAQSVGAKINNKMVGTFGDIACYSTMYRKNLISGSSGGILFTKKKKLYEKILAFSDRGKPIWKKNYNFRDPGMHLFPALNLNSDELSSAIAISSLSRLKKTINKRFKIYRSIKEKLEKNSEICRAYEFNGVPSIYFIPIWVNSEKISVSAEKFAKYLIKNGLPCNPKYKFLMSEWNWAKKYFEKKNITKNAIYNRNRSFNLYLNENYADKNVNKIIKIILKVEKILLKKNEFKN